jgi:hypothetical protein
MLKSLEARDMMLSRRRNPMNKTQTILAVIVLGIACMAFKCNKSGATFTGAQPCSKQTKSPKGATICSGGAIAANVPQIVDKQLDDLFRIAQNGQTNASGTNNYSPCPDGLYHPEVPCFSTHGSYHVWLIKRSPQCVNPGFTESVISAAWPDGYDETYTDSSDNHWDKDPRPGHTLLCVAGFMASGGGQMKGLELPGMAVVDAIDQMPIIRYEGEHNLLAQVDTARYAATQYHYGTNGGHPILGDDNGFAAEKLPFEVKPFETDVPGYGKVHALITQ